MSQYKISKKRLAEIIKEEYQSLQRRKTRRLNEDANDDTFAMVDTLQMILGPEQALEDIVQAMERSQAHKILKYVMRMREIPLEGEPMAGDEVEDYDPSAFNRNDENKKPDKDDDGVPDWADKKPGEDDHADKKKVKKESLDSIRQLIQQELKRV